MEFPFHHGHHHHRRGDEQDNPTYPPPASSNFHNNPYPPPPQQPPPPFYGGGMDQPPPPPPPRPHEAVTQVYHTSHVPPPGHVSHGFDNYASAPPPPPSAVFHHQHEPDRSSSNYGRQSAPSIPGYNPPPPGSNTNVHHIAHVSHRPDFSSTSVNVHHVSHHGGGAASAEFSNKPTVRVVTKADPSYSLTIREGKVILARSDPSDRYQHWYKDEKYSTRVKDSEGCPAFSLVNRVTGEAVKHSIGASHPVQLIPYNPNSLDESVLWTESRDLGDGHRAIRMVNNIHLNVDAYEGNPGNKNSGGVHDGTTIVLWDWNKGDNQRWKIIPY